MDDAAEGEAGEGPLAEILLVSIGCVIRCFCR